MRFRYASFVLILLLWSKGASAAEITLRSADWGNIWFGDAGVYAETDTSFDIQAGSLLLLSDVLLEKSLDAGIFSHYAFGAGTALFDLSVPTGLGSFVSGTFSVPMLWFVMGEFDETQVGIPTFPSSKYFVRLGSGLLPADLARALGVGTRITGGSVEGLVEGLEDPYDAPERYGKILVDSATLAVPEPTTMGLLATAGLFAAVRMGRRRRR